MKFAVEAHDVFRCYAPDRGICGVSLSVPCGECFALLGRNGSGKSTWVRLLTAQERPDKGFLSVLGSTPKRRERAFVSRLGVVMDNSIHWEELSGFQNAYFCARVRNVPVGDIPSRLGILFEKAGLADRAEDPVSTYSYGMRRKLSFIKALVHDPEVLVLDEPTAGLDDAFLLELNRILRNRYNLGRTSLICGTDADWIGSVASSAAFMEKGCIVAEGSMNALLAGVSGYQQMNVVLRNWIRVPVPGIRGIRSARQEGTTVHVVLEDGPEWIPRALEWFTSIGACIRRVEVRAPGLRDAFLLKTGYVLDYESE